MEQQLKRDPIWRQAVQDALSQFDYGDIITHEWIGKAFELPELRDPSEYRDRAHLVREVEAQRFALLRNMDRFREELLRDHNRALRTISGLGYEIVHPHEQTDMAMRRLKRDLGKAISRAHDTLVCIDDRRLDLEQSRHNSEQRAKLAALAVMTRQKLIDRDRADQAALDSATESDAE